MHRDDIGPHGLDLEGIADAHAFVDPGHARFLESPAKIFRGRVTGGFYDGDPLFHQDIHGFDDLNQFPMIRRVLEVQYNTFFVPVVVDDVYFNGII